MALRNIVFMGTPDFAVPALKALESEFHVAAVVTQPDKRAGRGKKMRPPAVKTAADSLGIPVMQPDNLGSAAFLNCLEKMDVDYIVTCAYGRILPPPILALPRQAALNIHASLLPFYRGAAPIQRAIMNGEQESGITMMHMDQGMDTGDIIFQQAVPITASETSGSLHDKLAELGAVLVIKTILALEQGVAPRIRQDQTLATYAPALNKEEERIDWCQSSAIIHDQVRGMNPWPGAYTELNGERLKIWAGRPAAASGGPCGTILALEDDGLAVATAGGAYLITGLQPAGKKMMSAADFVRGRQLAPGMKFQCGIAVQDND